ncbi:hypothetical protein Airi01_045130 [Actinoallomurus iriomotensis]|uniref:Uncharacterized protein n=1 Tax=Actinoallomurus iriomotensis TaxID=478107 RepID=A0A9W6RHN6_9ACTN|nr:hypothetical protein Airi01_045130 [Actinoallomurus iriomotensis]
MPQPRRTPGAVVAVTVPRRVRVRVVAVGVLVRARAPRTVMMSIGAVLTGPVTVGIDVPAGGRTGVMLRRAAGEGVTHVWHLPFYESTRPHAPPSRGLQPTSSVQGGGWGAEGAGDGCGKPAASGWTPYRSDSIMCV